MSEARLQSEIIRWLKSQGAYVVKTRPGAGVPVGCPDIIFMYGNKYGVIEVKATAKSPFRAGQLSTLRRLEIGNDFVYVVHPDIWPLVRDELSALFF